MKKRKKAAIHIAAALVVLILLGLYAWRVYTVNNSPLLDYAAEVIEYSENCDVPLKSGYYNRGYLKQEGYYAKVTNTLLCPIAELSSRGITTHTEQELIEKETGCTWIIIVSAEFRFDGEGNPLDGIIDMSDYQIIGPDYFINCSTELNELLIFNKFLSGNSAFSIASGKTIKVEIPFLVDSVSVHRVDEGFIKTHDVKLLLSRYPSEIYVKLDI